MDDEHVFTTHVLLDFHEGLAIGKRLDGALAELAADGFANGPGQRFVRCAAENFHALINKFPIKNEKPAAAGG